VFIPETRRTGLRPCAVWINRGLGYLIFIDIFMDILAENLFARLKDELGDQIFQTWFSPTKVLSWEDETLILQVPTRFYQEWIGGRYREIIASSAGAVSGQSPEVVLEVGEGLPAPTANPEPSRREEPAAPPKPPRPDLNPKYSFDSFVVGTCNRFAHAATMAVASEPGKAYNPLFLYGGVGLGKTHLMQAAAREILNQNPRARILYLSSETFTNEFIDAIANRTTDRFRQKYRGADALLIDDIHFLGGQVRTQEQFFHTFNILWDSHKQIILSSDRPPGDIPDVEERLISRFEWGLVVDLQPPDQETRMAILRREANRSQLQVPDEILNFIAERIRSNIRKLEGALIQVASYASLTNAPLTIPVVETILAGSLDGEIERCISIDEIQRKVAEFFDIRVADMKSSRRPKTIAFPRQIAMFISRDLTGCSLNEIGEAFGGRDHTTVLHACRTIEKKVSWDTNLAGTISHLGNRIRQGS